VDIKRGYEDIKRGGALRARDALEAVVHILVLTGYSCSLYTQYTTVVEKL
jgi:hypothetical protein